MRYGALILAMALTMLASCADSSPVAGDPPEVIGIVAAVDTAETVDSGRFLGALELTLVGGEVLQVPRGAEYEGPQCLFVAEGGDYGRNVVDCVVHVGVADDSVEWIRGFIIEPGGDVVPGFSTGDLLAVDLDAGHVVTMWGGTFPWENESPSVDCPHDPTLTIADPALLEHGSFHYRFDSGGYLTSIECGYEG